MAGQAGRSGDRRDVPISRPLLPVERLRTAGRAIMGGIPPLAASRLRLSACPTSVPCRVGRSSRVGAVGLTGLSLPNVLRAEKSRRPARRPRRASSCSFSSAGRATSTRSTRSRTPRRNPRRVQVDPHDVRRGSWSPSTCRGWPSGPHRYAVVRSVRHTTGRTTTPGRTTRSPAASRSSTSSPRTPSATDFPHPGSVVDYLDRPASGRCRRSVALPTMIADGPFRTPGEFAGFLGKAHDPLWVLNDPNAADFKVTELALPAGVDVGPASATGKAIQDGTRRTERPGRPGRRRSRGCATTRPGPSTCSTSPATQKAFDIQDEPADDCATATAGTPTARACCSPGGWSRPACASSPSTTRRGIGGWDTHKDNFQTLKDSRLPHTDATLSALLDDLEDRGLLDETLVYWTGDFGRTPKINKDAGRDHWPQCQSVLMAGGGVRGGRTYRRVGPVRGVPEGRPGPAGRHHRDHVPRPRPRPRDRDPRPARRPMPISAGDPILPLFG